MKDVLEKIFSPLEQERSLDATRVRIEGCLNSIDLQPSRHCKLRLLSVAKRCVVPHSDAAVPQKDGTDVQRPYRVLAGWSRR